MKRLLWIPLLFLCSTLWAAEPIQLARTNPYIAGAGVAAAASCQLWLDNTGGTNGLDRAIAYSSIAQDYRGVTVTPDAGGGNKQICQIDVTFGAKVGTINNFTMLMNIWAAAGTPGTLPENPITNGTASLACGADGSACNSTTGSFSFVSYPTLTAGTAYVVTLDRDTSNSANYATYNCRTDSGNAEISVLYSWKEDKTLNDTSTDSPRIKIYVWQ